MMQPRSRYYHQQSDQPEHIYLSKLHAGQRRAFALKARYRAVRCGRRWGKTEFAKVVMSTYAMRGRACGYFAPDYKLSGQVSRELRRELAPAIKSANMGLIQLHTGGSIEIWTLMDNETAGRSRKYHLAVIDEAAFTDRPGTSMMEIWMNAIRPTLLDYQGSAIVLSNTNGIDPENFFYRICTESEHGFKEYWAPTFDNPLIPLRRADESDDSWQARRDAEFELIRSTYHPMSFRQEIEAQFVDWRSEVVFATDKMMDPEGQPYDDIGIIDEIYAIIDTAIKSGSENDGTACTYFAHSLIPEEKIYVLDYDYVQFDGALLEHWLPSVLKRCEALSVQYRCRFGVSGVWIEDKGSGTILLQQGQAHGWDTKPISTLITSKGKDERAMAVVNHHHEGRCGITRHAYNKIVNYKSRPRNHLLSQLGSFRFGDKDAAKRADDLLDTYCYGLMVGLMSDTEVSQL
jgi:hypothetical protein